MQSGTVFFYFSSLYNHNKYFYVPTAIFSLHLFRNRLETPPNRKSTIRTCSQLYLNSFLPSLVREWNALPQACRDAISLESFKRSLNIEK